MNKDKIISANRLKKAIRTEQRVQRDASLSVKLVEYLIDNAPAEEVTQTVHGQWIIMQDGGISCSVCDHWHSPVDNWGRSQRNIFKFCPVCGARMDHK